MKGVKNPMTKHILLFCKKPDKFEKNVLIFRWKGSKISLYAKKHRGKNLTAKEGRGKETG